MFFVVVSISVHLLVVSVLALFSLSEIVFLMVSRLLLVLFFMELSLLVNSVSML